MPKPRLSSAALRRLLDVLGDSLGPTDLDRLTEIVPLLDRDHRASLSAVLALLFPNRERPSALTSLRQLRERLRAAAAGADLEFALVADSRRGDWCWFEGADLAEASAAAYADAETAGVRETERVPQSGLVLETRDGKPLVRLFVSYASRNRKLKEDLLRRLRVLFDIAADYCFEVWDDGEILPGERWHDEIRQALKRCQLGLLLVSPDFLASEFIREHELAEFLPPEGEAVSWRRAVPVGLKKVRFDGKVDLKGLERTQVFRDADGRFFAQRAADNTRDEFVDQLFGRIVDLVAKHLETPPLGGESEIVDTAPDTERHLAELVADALEETSLVPTRGLSTRLETWRDEKPAPQAPSGERRDALDFLAEWARDPGAPPFCALLGDYGMGKTTTCQAFTRRLLDERRTDPTLPQPIYLDLRHLGESAASFDALEGIIAAVLSRSWRGRSRDAALTATEVLRLVGEGQAIALFDGLDEVLVHLSPAAGRRFTRQLWSILPPAVFSDSGLRETHPAPPRGKLLISCRTHYFRTLRDEANHFLGEDREGLRPGDYRAFLLLPFSQEQIEEYLAKNLPDRDVDRLLELIGSVHNLPELAERPYTLSLIARHIPRLERARLDGHPVTGVTLYRNLVLSWLGRDDGKHQLTPDHKQRLMEYLAAALWRSGRRTWSVAEIEQWLIDFLADHPRVAGHYEGKDRELLKEDLRTATFLVRQGDDEFRFAHTSLQEYFLASHLARALAEGRPEDWDLPVPSLETLDFLGQLLQEGDAAASLETLRGIRARYHALRSELALAYALHARGTSYPALSLTGFHLEGADLRGWRFEADPSGPRLDLAGTNFRGTRLDGARFRHVDLGRADFREASLARAEVLDGLARAARFDAADLTGTVFRALDLNQAAFAGARLHRTQWLTCSLESLAGVDPGDPRAFFAECRPRDRYAGPAPGSGRRLEALTGHVGAARACAFSPDGRRLASAGSDGSVRLWDPDTGETLRILEGHRNGVLACAFSPDGRRLASAGSDGSVRLWDPDTGETLRILEGHRHAVYACAFSPDGRRLASAGDDGSVRLWDPDTGETLRILESHRHGVRACAFSPDGRRLASAGSDGSVRLWDPDTGETLRILEGHRHGVYACAFSPDGRRLASAGSDGSVRLWDPDTGETLRILEGHRHAVYACAFSPDGRRLASAGDDGSVRLWDPDTGETLRILEGHRNGVYACAFSPDGRRLASAGSDGSVRLWDPDTGETLRILEGHRHGVYACAFSPDGRRLASAGYDGSVRLWDPDTGETLRILEGHRNGVYACAFSPDGRRLASAGDDGSVRLWDPDTGETLRILEGHRHWVYACAFSPDGRRLASAGSDGSVRLWDPDTGETLRILEGHRNGVLACAFSPDGRRLASAGSDGSVRLWDPDTGETLRILEGHRNGVYACAFSPDGRRLASAGSDGSVRLWDPDTGETLRILEGHRNWVRACAFSPDGRRLASAGSDGSVRLWDPDTGETLRILEGHRNGVRACAFSPDGRRLASAGSDGSVRLWDPQRAVEVGPRIHYLPEAQLAVFGPGLDKLVGVTPDAWRWLGWQIPDPETGALIRHPAETFGPLPPLRVPS